MEELWAWFLAATGTTGVLGMLAGRFLRTREQKGSDMADMLTKISEAFEKTLATTMKYSTDVIEKMRTDDERSETRYRELEGRCLKLEQRLEDRESDRELLKSIVNEAVNCKFLKSGRNDECPVIRENQKRLKARCKKCTTPIKTTTP